MSLAASSQLPSNSLTHHRLVIAGTAVELALDAVSGGGSGLSAAAAYLAEELVADTLGVAVRGVRVAGLMPSGRPVATLADGRRGPSVSLAHVADLVGAAVASQRSVGIDIVDERDAGPALDCFFTAAELALEADQPAVLRARLWSAKEAAYKAACVDEPFQPRRTLVTGRTADRFTWTLAAEAGSIGGEGRWLRRGPWITAIAVSSDAGRAIGCDDPRAARATGGTP